MLSFLSASELNAQAPPAQAGQISLKTMTLEELLKVEFTTISKGSTEAFKTPAAINVLQREDIARSGATNIPDLLRLIPGVEVAQISSDRWAIGIRGFQGYLSRSVLVLIDGRSVYTPLFAGVYWEMQDAFIEDIDRIEVIRGPAGTIWGANAINGVINIITRNARDTVGTLVTAGGGNVEQGFFGYRYGAGDNTQAYRVWVKGFTRGPQFHSDGSNFDDWRRVQAGFRLDRALNQRDELSVIGNIYAVESGTRLAISTFSPPQVINLEQNATFYGENLNATWRRTLQNGASAQLRAYFDRTDRRDLNYREIRDTFDIDFVHHVVFGAHDITTGAGMRQSPAHFFQTVPSVNFLPAKQRYAIYSGFAQDAIRFLSNRLETTIGVKVEHNSFSGFESQPSVRVAWTPSEDQTFWLAVTRAVRTPSRIEEGFEFSALIVPATPLYVRLVGDSQFEPEKLNGYEVGYRAYLKKHGFIGISAFYNRYEDLLSVEQAPTFSEDEPSPIHSVLPLLLRNGIRAQTAGFEVSSLLDVNSWWRVKPAYSLVNVDAKRAPNSIDVSTVGQLEGDTPTHKVLVQSMFTFPRGLNIDLRYRYVSAIPNQKIPSYSTGDARIAMKVSPDLELSLVGLNLFQPHHPEYSGLPGGPVEIRRSAYLKLVWAH
jgi:iron complex outermembrane receptor protein